MPWVFLFLAGLCEIAWAVGLTLLLFVEEVLVPETIFVAGPGSPLRVGPRSSGADPGPACYGRGGSLPTITAPAKRPLSRLCCLAKSWRQFFAKKNPVSLVPGWMKFSRPPLDVSIRDVPTSSAVADATINTPTMNISSRSKLSF